MWRQLLELEALSPWEDMTSRERRICVSRVATAGSAWERLLEQDEMIHGQVHFEAKLLGMLLKCGDLVLVHVAPDDSEEGRTAMVPRPHYQEETVQYFTCIGIYLLMLSLC